MEKEIKDCSTCIGKFEYKSQGKCRYCKRNTEDYLGRDESKMHQDNYKHADDSGSNLPF